MKINSWNKNKLVLYPIKTLFYKNGLPYLTKEYKQK